MAFSLELYFYYIYVLLLLKYKLKSNIFLKFVLFFLIFFLSVFSKAQTPYYKNYTVKDGLPSSETYQVFQDSKGYIWIASDNGVARFDGYSFKVFTTRDGLPDNTIFGFYEDKLGRIWFRSFSGKLSYFKDGKITCLKINEELHKKLKQEIFISMAFKNDTLWLGAVKSLEIYKVVWDKKGKEKLVLDRFEGYGNYLYQIDKKNFIYGYSYCNLQMLGKSCFTDIYDFRNLTFVNKKVTNKTIGFPKSKTDNPHRICIRYKQNNYLYSLGNSLTVLNDYGDIKETYSLDDEVILSLHEDKNGGVWVGTYKHGVYYYPDGNLKNKPISYLNTESITFCIDDKESGIWLSSLESGIYYISYKNHKNYSFENGDINSKISCVKTINNELWVGFENGIIRIYGREKLKEYNLNGVNSNSKITYITPLKNGNVIIGTYYSSFIIENSKQKIRKFVDLYSSGLLQSKIDNSIWLIRSLDIIHFKKFPKSENSDTIEFDDKIQTFIQDSKGTIWLGGMKGLWYIQANKVVKDNHKLLQERINDLKISKNNIFWMTTKGNGVLIKNGKKVYNINSSNGLCGDVCQAVAIETDKIAWIGTNKGMSKISITSFKPFKYKIQNFTIQNGLLSNEINDLELKGDTIYVSSNEGITFFNKKHIAKNSFQPPIYISKININDKNIKLANTYQLRYNQNNIRIDYVGLSYKNAGNVKYSYRLKGLTEKWTRTKYTSANFTTLPYGDYTFEVKAQNNDGYWSKLPASIQLSISPPFWNTWLFRIMASLSFIGSVFAYIKYRINIIEKRSQEKTELYKKAAEMEMKFLSSQMNPHFTFNAMNSIQYFMLENSPQKAQDYLAKYSKLIRRVLENNMEKYTPLMDEIEMLELYMEIESMRFEGGFEIEINVSYELEVNDYLIAPMLLQPYIENAIWHGLVHKKDGKGKISLSFTLERDTIKCVIEDNGVGREKAKEFRTSEKEHRSVGMLITHQRMEYLNTDSKEEIKAEIIDLQNKHGEGCGTRVDIYLSIILED